MSKCKSKVSYNSKELADSALKVIREKSKKKKGPIRSYKCSLCEKWHLTSARPIEEIELENKQLRQVILDMGIEIMGLKNQIEHLTQKK